MRKQVIAGAIIAAIGLADLAGWVPGLEDYAYGVVWWGVLMLVDAWNFEHHGLSMWRGNAGHFLAITLPVSVLVWLLFELLNLPAPQWRYRGGLPSMQAKVLFGFVSFSTVVPIMAEAWWLVGGRQGMPVRWLAWFHRRRALCIALACLFGLIPLVNEVFWWNQGMWLIPALVLFPFSQIDDCPNLRFVQVLIASGLIAGAAWESFNTPAATHWEYLILPDAPHLGYMPLPGYLGFIPFAFSMLAVYEFQRQLRASACLAAVLYASALGGMYWITRIYVERGIWLLA